MLTVGIDEVGRGCWAGPVVAGAVLLPDDFIVPSDADWRLTDSKLMKPAERLESAGYINVHALNIGLGWVTAREVDEFGLTQAVRLAMSRALNVIERAYETIIIDGSFNFLQDNPRAKAVVKADSTVPSVSAASIVAKVARDAYMIEQARLLPEYGFESHVGYGTKRHIEALRQHGVCELHRRSYKPIKAFL